MHPVAVLEIAALKKYLFSFFQIALGSERAGRRENVCLLS